MSKPRKKSPFTAADFYAEDYQKTLFPLRTNKVLAETGFGKLASFARKPGSKFLPQRRVSAMKVGSHLRRTFKLDPVAEVFLYELAFKHRSIFRKSVSKKRECFGYRFEEGRPLDATSSYRAFKGATREYAKSFKFGLSFDVASYFNSVYHHDLVHWLEERIGDKDDVSLFGSFLREINSGRSVDCLPQGLYPAKMIGNEFLKFVDSSSKLSSARFVRFMDDITILSNSRENLMADFMVVQDLLGQKGLSVNPAKTRFIDKSTSDVGREVDAVRKALLHKRRTLIVVGYEEDEDEEGEVEAARNLTKKEVLT